MIICNLFSGSSQSTTKPLNDYTWYEISRIAKTGAARNYFSIGDTKYFKITVEDIEYELGATIIGFNHDDVTNSEEYGQTKAGITFQVFTTSLKPKGMRPIEDLYGFIDWYHSTLRYWMGDTLYNSLGELKPFIVSVKKKCSPSGISKDDNSGIYYTGRPDSAPPGGYPTYDEIDAYAIDDKLFLLSLIECNAYERQSSHDEFAQDYSNTSRSFEFVPKYKDEGSTYEYYQIDPSSSERYKNKNINTIFNFGTTILDKFSGEIMETSNNSISGPFPLRTMGLIRGNNSGTYPCIYYIRRISTYNNALICSSKYDEMSISDDIFSSEIYHLLPTGEYYIPLSFAFCL